MEDALNREDFGTAQSLASGQFCLYHGTISSLTALTQTRDTKKIQLDASGCVIKLSMLLQKKQPVWGQTFADFSKFLHNEIMDISSLFNRCYGILDQYFERS